MNNTLMCRDCGEWQGGFHVCKPTQACLVIYSDDECSRARELANRWRAALNDEQLDKLEQDFREAMRGSR